MGRISEGDGDPRHGTMNGYVNLRCRCGECRAANATYYREGRGRLRRDEYLARVHAERRAVIDGLVPMADVTRQIGIDKSTASRRIRSGLITNVIKFNGRYYMKPDDARALIDACRQHNELYGTLYGTRGAA